MKKKEVLIFTNDTWESALSQVRLRGPLEAAGYSVAPGNDREKCLVEDLEDVDFVVIQRDFPQYLNLLLFVLKETRERQIPLIYEIDDLLFCLPENHPLQKNGIYSRNFIPMLIATRLADLVTVSTEPLAHFLRPFNPNVKVLPNYLNDKLWEFSPFEEHQRRDLPVVIGYIGGSTHKPDIAMIVNALIRIKKKFQRKVTFKFWGAEPPQELVSRCTVDWQPIVASYQEYAKVFRNQRIDILVAPLEDNLFNQSKSSLKYLEYSTLGVPGVFSRIKPFKDVVEHGNTGFLASSEDEWVKFLEELITSPELRMKIARNAQESVKKGLLLSDHGQEWAEAYGTIGDVLSKFQEPSLSRYLAQESFIKDLQELNFDKSDCSDRTFGPNHQPPLDDAASSLLEKRHLLFWKIQKSIKKIFSKG